MRRVCSLFLPRLPTDRQRKILGAKLSPDRPLVLVGREGNRRQILSVDGAAASLGLRVGMSASSAQAKIPGLELRDCDLGGDGKALEQLGLWALQRYSPIVAADSPDGLVIDTTGADHLNGGEKRLLEDLVGRCASAGLSARAAIADTWGAAHAAARFLPDPVSVIAPGGNKELLSPLPVAALRLAPECVEALHVLGFGTIGDLLAAPSAPLTLRFGPEVMRRIDQALGKQAEPIDPIHAQEMIEAKQAFGEPIAAAETIARYIEKLVSIVCTDLEAKGLGARGLDLLCRRVDNQTQAVRIGTALPNRDPKRLTRLLSDKIETIDPGFGIETLVLRVSRAEPVSPRQVLSRLTDAPDADVSGLIDILSNRVGSQHLYRVAPVASDVPERSVKRVPAASPAKGQSWPLHWPRPSRLLKTPEPIECLALLPDHPPKTFTWRGVRRRVKCADGPERVFGEWWKRDAELVSVRDYFQVEDEAGERYWLFRAGDGEHRETGDAAWYIHGVFG